MVIAQITQFVQESDIVSLVGGGTIGSIATQLISKWITRKKDNSDISSQQALLLKTVNDDLSNVVAKLQSIACYRDKCRIRINGEEAEK